MLFLALMRTHGFPSTPMLCLPNVSWQLFLSEGEAETLTWRCHFLWCWRGHLPSGLWCLSQRRNDKNQVWTHVVMWQVTSGRRCDCETVETFCCCWVTFSVSDQFWFHFVFYSAFFFSILSSWSRFPLPAVICVSPVSPCLCRLFCKAAFSVWFGLF